MMKAIKDLVTPLTALMLFLSPFIIYVTHVYGFINDLGTMIMGVITFSIGITIIFQMEKRSKTLKK